MTCDSSIFEKPLSFDHSSRLLKRTVDQIPHAPRKQFVGRVVQVIGLIIESEGPDASVGELCHISPSKHEHSIPCEVVGFRGNRVLLMPLGETRDIHPGAKVMSTGHKLRVAVGPGLLGRILNGLGEPIDELGPIDYEVKVPLDLQPPHLLRRKRISERFYTGIRSIDTLIPIGKGQRVGIFAGSGVGKSTLLGMIARNAECDINVISLVGERIREVREFIENDLGEEGLKKSVLIAATSNQPALVRQKAAFLSMAIAEYFRDQGKDVLLMMDSVTRFAMAQREIGLAVGEPPATRGYTPSVFSMLPQLLERAGTGESGSITGLFTTLVEGDDMNDPIGDTVRAILDGHMVLSRDLANQGHYPPIQVLESLSRLQGTLLSDHQKNINTFTRECLDVYRKNKDLIQVGAYQEGVNPNTDKALKLVDRINFFLRQGINESVDPKSCFKQLEHVLT